MFETLFGLIFLSVPDLLIGGIYYAACAWNRDAANSQPRPYGWRNRTDDPVYVNNLQRRIERNRQFAEAREARHARRSQYD
jgi:hypothetical protein